MNDLVATNEAAGAVRPTAAAWYGRAVGACRDGWRDRLRAMHDINIAAKPHRQSPEALAPGRPIATGARRVASRRPQPRRPR